MVPVFVTAPQMQRFQVFGHLFAGLGDQVYRLDGHPVMARHPVTPMAESDVARHIATQLSQNRRDTLVGRMIWDGCDANRFVVGSQGVEYALVRHWVETGEIEPTTHCSQK